MGQQASSPFLSLCYWRLCIIHKCTPVIYSLFCLCWQNPIQCLDWLLSLSGLMNIASPLLVLNFNFAECDIEYVDPSAYVPPDDGMPSTNNGCSLDEDPYEKLVRGNLRILDKQKVRFIPPTFVLSSFNWNLGQFAI